MRIIPVIDIIRGVVVHAVAGERDSYKPVNGILTRDPSPLSVANAFLKLHLEELYIADLDAIRRIGHNSMEVGKIVAETGMRVIIDAGFRRMNDVSGYVKMGVEKIVLATETLESFGEISKIIDAYKTPVVASIDLKPGGVIAESDTMRLGLKELIRKFEDGGVSEFILLSLDRVGTQIGPNVELLKLTLQYTDLPVIVGGGVRSTEDIYLLRENGAAGVLVATSLHTGLITKQDIAQLKLC